MPSPINSVRTRVIYTGSGYVAQMSACGMMWYDLPTAMHAIEGGEDAFGLAEDIALAASQLPSTGKIVWTSDAK